MISITRPGVLQRKATQRNGCLDGRCQGGKEKNPTSDSDRGNDNSGTHTCHNINGPLIRHHGSNGDTVFGGMTVVLITVLLVPVIYRALAEMRIRRKA
jgi:hypothetical protein